MPTAKGKTPSLSKARATFRMNFQRYCDRLGADPFKWMAQTLADATTWIDGEGKEHYTVPLPIKVECATQLAQYLQPKLRAIELSADADNPVLILQAMPQGELDAYLAKLLVAVGGSIPFALAPGGLGEGAAMEDAGELHPQDGNGTHAD